MTTITSPANITTNGEFQFAVRSSSTKVPLEVDGNFDGGTVTPGYLGIGGSFVPLRDTAGAVITTTNPTCWEVVVPLSGVLAVKLAGAGAPALKVGCGSLSFA